MSKATLMLSFLHGIIAYFNTKLRTGFLPFEQFECVSLSMSSSGQKRASAHLAIFNRESLFKKDVRFHYARKLNDAFRMPLLMAQSPHHASGNNGALRAPPRFKAQQCTPRAIPITRHLPPASGPTPIATAKTNAHKMIGAVRISAIAVFAASDPALFDKRIAAQRRKQKKAPKWEPSNTSRR